MEGLCKRFPLLGKMVFENVDDECLVKFKESSREINNHLQNERYYWTRIIKKHGEYFEEFADSWKKVICKTPAGAVKELALTVEGYFNFSDFHDPVFQLHPLHVAAEQGNLNLCQDIVEKTGDFNPATTNKATALHFAAYQGQLKVYQFILDNVDDKNPVDANGYCPFFLAVLNNQVKFCKVIIKTVEEKNPTNPNYEFTALHEAAAKGNLEMCQLLIDNMTGDKNPGEFGGWTPLHDAAKNGHLEICRLIAQQLEDKNPRDVIGWTPLHWAAELGHFEICQLIAQDLEDKNPMTNDGTTPKQLMNDYIEELKNNANDLFQ